MYLRISRVRFVIVRVCLLLIIFLLVLEFRLTFKTPSISSSKNPVEIAFWRKLHNLDRLLTDKQKIEQIELLDKQRKRNDLNWTNIFYHVYHKKTNKLYEKDMKNIEKSRWVENESSTLQNTYDIYEETPVCKRITPKFCFNKLFFFRFFNNQNFAHQRRSFIVNARIKIVNGNVKIPRQIMKIIVARVFSIM